MGTSKQQYYDTPEYDDTMLDLSSADTANIIIVDDVFSNLNISTLSIGTDDVYTNTVYSNTINVQEVASDMIWTNNANGEQINITQSIRELTDMVRVMRAVMSEIAPELDFDRRIEQYKMLDKLSQDA